MPLSSLSRGDAIGLYLKQKTSEVIASFSLSFQTLFLQIIYDAKKSWRGEFYFVQLFSFILYGFLLSEETTQNKTSKLEVQEAR